jgi:uncharacterized protein YoxC
MGMLGGQFIDLLQSGSLVIVTLALCFVLVTVRREMRETAKAMREVLHGQQDVRGDIERLWRRMEAVEMRQGIHTDVDALARLKRLADAIETALRPNNHP